MKKYRTALRLLAMAGALILGLTLAHAELNPETQRWVEGFMANTMNEKWAASMPGGNSGPCSDGFYNCVAAVSVYKVVLKPGLDWLNSHPGPACLPNTSLMAVESWTLQAQGADAFLMGIRQGRPDLAQQGVDLMVHGQQLTKRLEDYLRSEAPGCMM
jgi:hypothetical protein